MLHFFTQLATNLTQPFSLVINFDCLSQPINLSPLFCDNTVNQPANVCVFISQTPNLRLELGILCYDAIMLLSEMSAWNWLRRKYRGNVKNGIWLSRTRA
jgi:hypothetical protein